MRGHGNEELGWFCWSPPGQLDRQIEVAAGARLLVTMGCGESCPVVPGLQRDDWPLADPKGQPIERVREIRDQIRERVRQLVETRVWSRRA